MRLAVNLGYWDRAAAAHDMVAIAQEADRLGYDSVWVAEAYGSDAPSMLAWIGALTQRIHLGSAVMQIPARTPAMTGMTAATIDDVGRALPARPRSIRSPGQRGLARRPVHEPARANPRLRRGRPVRPGPGKGQPRRTALRAAPPDGPGKALKLGSRPLRSEIPVYLAAVGPRNLALTGEIADGWLAIFLSPEHAGEQIEAISAARRAAGAWRRSRTPWPASTSCPRLRGAHRRRRGRRGPAA